MVKVRASIAGCKWKWRIWLVIKYGWNLIEEKREDLVVNSAGTEERT